MLGARLELLLQHLDLALLDADLLLGDFDRHHLQRLVALGVRLLGGGLGLGALGDRLGLGVGGGLLALGLLLQTVGLAVGGPLGLGEAPLGLRLRADDLGDLGAL